MKTLRAVLIVIVLSALVIVGVALTPLVALVGWLTAVARGGVVAAGLRADLEAATRDRDKWQELYRRTIERAAGERQPPGPSMAQNQTVTHVRCLVKNLADADWHEVDDAGVATIKAGMEQRPEVFEGCRLVELEVQS